MHLARFSQLGINVLLLAWALNIQPALAKDGRDFAGHYALMDVVQHGDVVRVTLVLDLINNCGTDLDQANITVGSSEPHSELLGGFAPVRRWRNNADIVVSREFEIPRDEYQRWCGRGQPRVFVIYTDDLGREWRRWAQLSRRPIIREPGVAGR